MSRKFDRFMLAIDLGSNPKVGRLTDSEFRCMVTGIWALAAKAPIRGALIVGDHPATTADIARFSRMPERVADKTLDKMRAVGLLERDEELGCDMIHDWGEINPEPRRDATAADRQRRYRARLKNRHDAPAPGPAAAPVPDGPPAVRFDRKPVPPARLELALRVLADFNELVGTRYGPFTGAGRPSDALTRVIGALTAWPELDAERCRRMVRAALSGERWWDGRPSVGVVFGPAVVEKLMAATAPRERPAAPDAPVDERPAPPSRVAPFRGRAGVRVGAGR